MSEEERLAKNIQELSFGKLETRNLDTCMTYGISGLCGKECPKFKDKTCEVYLDTLEKEYNSLQNQLQQKENIIKEVREYIENNWISQKDADNYRFDDEELNIEISDIAVLFDVLDKEVN